MTDAEFTGALNVTLIARRGMAPTSSATRRFVASSELVAYPWDVPLRIVSLCPSITRTLLDLGLGGQVVGRTSYCEDLRDKPAVGGPKDPDFAAIAQLRPTHLLFNLEENDYTHRPLAEAICETLVHTPTDILEASAFVVDLARQLDPSDASGARTRALAITAELDAARERVLRARCDFTYLYFIWNAPRRIAGTGTYIDAMLAAGGGQNLAATFSQERYPLLPDRPLPLADVVLLSSEPYPFGEKHIPTYRRYGHRVRLIDGRALCWPGSETPRGLKMLAAFLGELLSS